MTIKTFFSPRERSFRVKLGVITAGVLVAGSASVALSMHASAATAGAPSGGACVTGTSNGESIDLSDAVDTVALENLYQDFATRLSTNVKELPALFATNGVLDIDGQKEVGKAAITAFVDQASAAPAPPAGSPSEDLLVTNVFVKVCGNHAIGHAYWTGLGITTITALPTFLESGTYTDTFVKIGGSWFITSRTVQSRSGEPAVFQNTSS